jgi:signal peptidase I
MNPEVTEYPAQGMSMGKRWQDAMSLIVLSPEHKKPRWSDVILYQTSRGLVAHRVVQITQRNGRCWFITKGDGYWMPDRVPIVESDILGTIISVRKMNRLLNADSISERIRAILAGVLGWIGLWCWPPIWEAVDGTTIKPG